MLLSIEKEIKQCPKRERKGKVLTMKKTNTTTEMTPEVATDLICVVQRNHANYKTETRKANEIAERNRNAREYSARVERRHKAKEILATVTLATVEFGGLLAMILYAFFK